MKKMNSKKILTLNNIDIEIYTNIHWKGEVTEIGYVQGEFFFRIRIKGGVVVGYFIPLPSKLCR